MKKSRKTVTIILEAAVLVGLAGGFYYVQQKQIAPTTVYEYSRDLKEATVIDSSDISQVTVPSDAVTSKMVTNPDDIIGKAVDSNVYAGDYITSGVLVDAKDVDVFSTMDLSNYRQIAIEVSRQDCVGGNLSSGDKVDLGYIARGSSTEGTENLAFTYSTTFMKDVLVYKVLTSSGEEYVNQTDGPVYDEDGNRIQSTPGIVILAVTADQAEEILARQSTGTVKLIGRFDTSEDTDTTGYIMGDYGKVYTYYANPEE